MNPVLTALELSSPGRFRFDFLRSPFHCGRGVTLPDEFYNTLHAGNLGAGRGAKFGLYPAKVQRNLKYNVLVFPHDCANPPHAFAVWGAAPWTPLHFGGPPPQAPRLGRCRPWYQVFGTRVHPVLGCGEGFIQVPFRSGQGPRVSAGGLSQFLVVSHGLPVYPPPPPALF